MQNTNEPMKQLICKQTFQKQTNQSEEKLNKPKISEKNKHKPDSSSNAKSGNQEKCAKNGLRQGTSDNCGFLGSLSTRSFSRSWSCRFGKDALKIFSFRGNNNKELC